MNLINYIMNRLSPREMPILLGRWRMEKCNMKIHNKIDLSNEDHCGTCGEYAFEKVNLNLVNKAIVKINNVNKAIVKFNNKKL
jgi:hypothetical protein